MELKNWTDAEAECQRGRGHLASVTTEYLDKILSRMADSYGVSQKGVWLGGRQIMWEWNWSDNSPWGFNNWREGVEHSRYEACVESFDGRWKDDFCTEEKEFICQLKVTLARGTQTVKYKKDKLGFSSFHVWYNYKAASQQLLDT